MIAAPAHRALRWLCLLCVVLVTHGSLYPWRIVIPVDPGGALLALFLQTDWWTGPGDAAGNVALFVPVGVLGTLVLEGSRTPASFRLPALILFALAFSLVLQVAQVFVPARSPALSDVAWNTLGLLAGIAATWFARRLPTRARVKAQPLPLAMTLMWLVIEWWPLVPTIDWQHIKDALKPLLLAPRWRTGPALEAAIGVAALAQLLHERPRRGAHLLALVALAAAGKLFIEGQSHSIAHASGLVAGLLLAWCVWRLDAARAAPWVIGAALAWFAIDALRPWEIAERQSRFEWIPFIALLQGSMGGNAAALLHNVFWLGVVMVLASGMRARLGALAIGLALCVLALEGAQTWLAGRIADVTPALIPLVWWLVLRAAPAAR